MGSSVQFTFIVIIIILFFDLFLSLPLVLVRSQLVTRSDVWFVATIYGIIIVVYLFKLNICDEVEK